jgi:hypothetical protein
MRNLSILILAWLVFSGVSAMPEESLRELQSEELRRVYRENPAADLQRLIASEEAREHMLQQALFYAGRNAPVDNRAYLFALAVDLYHSLPPGPDPTGYEPGELGGKGEWMRWFQNWLDADRRDIDQDDDRDRAHDARSDTPVATVEINHIRHYFQEHVQLDDFIEHASLYPEDLSFSNPTHYAALRTYVDSMQHRIRSDASNEADEAGKAAPAATGSPVHATGAPGSAAPFTAPAPEKNSVMPSFMKWATGALLVVAIVFFMRKRGRRG